MSAVVEYILCYSFAFLLGAGCGIVLMIATKHKPSKSAMWRKRHGQRR